MRIYSLLKPILFRLEAERAHQLVMASWSTLTQLPGSRLLTNPLRFQHAALAAKVAGIRFSNPVGLAAGFDKDGRYCQSLAQLGFGFLELGTVTPRPQAGSSRPRLFRLVEDHALINRMGFNNQGAEALARRLQRAPRSLPLGINIGKNRDTPVAEAVDDYLDCFQLLAPLANYITVNVSSPNTPGLRDLQHGDLLAEILAALTEAREQAQRESTATQTPIFVKLSPDETPASLDTALQVLLSANASGIILTNTTTARSPKLRNPRASEPGGLSGAPLRERATEVTRYVYTAVDGKLPIIGVGGIDSPQAAYERILAGASLIQIYTGLIYEGPGAVTNILHGLLKYLQRDNLSTIEQAVGAEASTRAEI